MASDEDAVRAVMARFYGAIEELATGKGVESMTAVWHHSPRVTSGHPTGNWARGWDEVLATWQVFASFGRPDNGGSGYRDLDVQVFGDIAYATSVFVAGPGFGSARMNVTNILRRVDGEWKLIHHHPDPAPDLAVAMEKMLEE